MRTTSSFLEKINLGLTAAILFMTPLIFSPYANLNFELPKVSFFRNLIMLMLFIKLLEIFKNKKITLPPWKRHKVITILLVTFITLQILATIFSIAPIQSFFGGYQRIQGLNTILHLAAFFALILATPSIYSKKLFLLVAAILSGTLASIYGLLQKSGLDPMKHWDNEAFLGRIFSTLGHPNFLGQFVIITILLNAAIFLIVQEKKYKILLITSGLLQIVALTFTLSRSAFLGLAAGIISAFFLFAKIRSPKFFKIGLVTFFAGFFAIISINLARDFSIIQNTPFLHRIVVSGENLRSIQSRLQIWPVALNVILDHPFFGSGPETFSLSFTQYQPKELLELEDFTETADRAHNEVLDTAINIGIPGTLIYYFLLALIAFSVIKQLPHAQKNDQIMLIFSLAAVISQIVANQFGFPSIVHLIYFWFLLALIVKILLAVHQPGAITAQSHNFATHTSLEHYSHKNLSPEIIIKLSYYKPAVALILSLSGIFLAFGAYYNNIRPLQADKIFKRTEFEIRKINPQDQQQVEKVRDDYEKTVKKSPYFSYYRYFQSHAASLLAKAQQNPESKKQYLELAINAAEAGKKISNGYDFNAWYLLGEAYSILALETPAGLQSGPGREKAAAELAIENFNQGLKIAPNNPRLHRAKAYNLFKFGLYQASIEAYEQYLQIAPAYWKWNLEEKKPEEREKHRIFFKLNPDFYENFLYLSRAYTSRANELPDEQKAAYFSQALYYLQFYQPDNVDKFSTYAVIYNLMGDNEKALEYINKGLEIDPENPILKKNLELLQQ